MLKPLLTTSCAARPQPRWAIRTTTSANVALLAVSVAFFLAACSPTRSLDAEGAPVSQGQPDTQVVETTTMDDDTIPTTPVDATENVAEKSTVALQPPSIETTATGQLSADTAVTTTTIEQAQSPTNVDPIEQSGEADITTTIAPTEGAPQYSATILDGAGIAVDRLSPSLGMGGYFTPVAVNPELFAETSLFAVQGVVEGLRTVVPTPSGDLDIATITSMHDLSGLITRTIVDLDNVQIIGQRRGVGNPVIAGTVLSFAVTGGVYPFSVSPEDAHRIGLTIPDPDDESIEVFPDETVDLSLSMASGLTLEVGDTVIAFLTLGDFVPTPGGAPALTPITPIGDGVYVVEESSAKSAVHLTDTPEEVALEVLYLEAKQLGELGLPPPTYRETWDLIYESARAGRG